MKEERRLFFANMVKEEEKEDKSLAFINITFVIVFDLCFLLGGVVLVLGEI